MSLKPGDKLGSYVITAEIGRGGMGIVYLAEQPSLRRNVAIKILPEFFAEDSAFSERFAREAATVAHLRHPNIVTIIDYGQENSTHYIVMEYVPGGNLTARLGSPLPPDEAVAVLRPLASALDYAHGMGVIHRDVKPLNILIGEDGAPVLTDFGLAHLLGSMPPLTRTGAQIGTFEYMSPEQANGEVAGPGTDRYGLAVLAFEMLTGGLPYQGPSPIAVLLAHVGEEIPSASARNAGLPAAVDAVLTRGLEKDPANRFQTAVEFVSALAWSLGEGPAPMPAVAPNLSPPSAAVVEEPPPSSWSRNIPDVDGPLSVPDARIPAFIEAVQKPLPLLAFTGAAALFIYMALLSGSLGYGWVAVIGLLLLLGTGTFLVISTFDDTRRETEGILVARAEAQQLKRERENLGHQSEELRSAFESPDLRDGRRALDQISRAFEELEPQLVRREMDPLLLALMPRLSVQIYRQGLNLLSDSCDFGDPYYTEEQERRRRQIEEYEAEIAALDDDPTQAENISLKLGYMASEKKSLDIMQANQLKFGRLVLQARGCAIQLQEARNDLLGIRSGDRATDAESLIEAMQRTLQQAKEVQAEIRKLGF
jgi:serine/threonine protein kinase